MTMQMADILPVEVVTHILTFLDTPDKEEASAVCRKWYQASLDPCLHRKTVITLKALVAATSHLPGLGHRKSPHLVISYIDGSNGSSWVINEMGRHLGVHLNSLSLRGCDISETMFVKIMVHCTNLVSLDLGCCNTLFMSGNLLKNEEDKLNVSAALKNVKELALNSIRYLSDVLFNRLVSTLPSLERLSLAGCNIAFEMDPRNGENNLADSVTFVTFSNLIIYFTGQALLLRHLDFSHTAITSVAVETLACIPDLNLTDLILQNCSNLTDKGVTALAKHSSGLRTLELTECRSLIGPGIRSVVDNMSSLKKLKISGLRAIPSDISEDLFTKLPELQHLSISCLGLMSEGICSGLERASQTQLVCLDLSGCVQVDDSTVFALSIAAPNIQDLNLKSCQALSDKAVHIIAQSFVNLKRLNLAWCMHITDFGLLGLDKNSPEVAPRKEADKYHSARYTRSHSNMGFFTIPKFEEKIQKVTAKVLQIQVDERSRPGLESLTKLEFLNLSNCSHLTDVGIQACIRFPRLKYLHLAFCRNLTDKSVASVTHFNPNIENLNLSQCYLVTDLGLRLIASNLRNLKTLNLSGCVKVSDKTFPVFAENCHRLKYINLSQCGMVSLGAVKKLTNEIPSIHKIEIGQTGSSSASLYQPDFF